MSNLAVDPTLHIGLVHSIVERTGPHRDPEEITSVAYIGLLKACRDFDPSRRLRFSTPATKYIKMEIQAYYRKMRAMKRDAGRTVPLTDPVAVRVGHRLPPSDYERHDEEVDTRLQAEFILSVIHPKLAEVLRRRAAGETLSEISAVMGISRQMVQRYETVAFEQAQIAAGVRQPRFTSFVQYRNANRHRRSRLDFPNTDSCKFAPREMRRY